MEKQGRRVKKFPTRRHPERAGSLRAPGYDEVDRIFCDAIKDALAR